MEHYKNISLENITEEIDCVLYTEEWRDIKGYEGLYKISFFGRVKSMARKVSSGFGSKRRVPERIMKQKMDKDGYLHIALSSNGEMYHKRVHRLVAQEFIENPENKPEVNHKNLIKTDNRAIKLEWATNKENIEHGNVELPNRKWNPHMIGKSGYLHHNSKKVYCSTLDIYFGSAAEAERELYIHPTGVSAVCTGKQIHCDGLVFRYI